VNLLTINVVCGDLEGMFVSLLRIIGDQNFLRIFGKIGIRIS